MLVHRFLVFCARYSVVTKQFMQSLSVRGCVVHVQLGFGAVVCFLHLVQYSSSGTVLCLVCSG